MLYTLCFIVAALTQEISLSSVVIEAREIRITDITEQFVTHISDCRSLIWDAATDGREEFAGDLYKWGGDRFDDLQDALSEAARQQFGDLFAVRVARFNDEMIATTLVWSPSAYPLFYSSDYVYEI